MDREKEMAELKPCPFCGGEADFLSGGTVKCKKCCGAFLVTNPIISLYEVANAWNTRTPKERGAE